VAEQIAGGLYLLAVSGDGGKNPTSTTSRLWGVA